MLAIISSINEEDLMTLLLLSVNDRVLEVSWLSTVCSHENAGEKVWILSDKQNFEIMKDYRTDDNFFQADSVEA